MTVVGKTWNKDVTAWIEMVEVLPAYNSRGAWRLSERMHEKRLDKAERRPNKYTLIIHLINNVFVNMSYLQLVKWHSFYSKKKVA
jgi:hypothetical protein